MKQDQAYWSSLSADLLDLGLESPKVRTALEWTFEKGLSEYQYTHSQLINGDKLNLKLDFQRVADEPFWLQGYYATLFRTGPIIHDTFDGLSTHRLEERMRLLPWNGVLPPSAEGIYEDLKKLWESKEEKFMDIADRLQARYWLDTAMERKLGLEHLRQKYVRSYYFDFYQTYDTPSFRNAANLLCERSVALYTSPELENSECFWAKIIRPDSHLFSALVRYPDFGIGEELRALPIKGINDPSIAGPLLLDILNGDQAPVLVQKEGKWIKHYVEADGPGQTVSLYNVRYEKLDKKPYLELKAALVKDNPSQVITPPEPKLFIQKDNENPKAKKPGYRL